MTSRERRTADVHDGSRVVPFTVNTRDLGGLCGAGGRRVRAGLFYRGSATAIGPLTARYGLRTVVDLRSEGESADPPRHPAENARPEVLARPVVGERAAIKRDGQPQPSDYLAYYRLLVPLAAPVVVDLVRLLTEPARLPVLVCCSVGKDRTSVVCALALRVLGIRLADIIRDHALSARLLRRDPSAPRTIAWARRLSRREFEVRTSVVGWTVGRLLADLELTHGSVYRLLAAYGLRQSTVDEARTVLLSDDRWRRPDQDPRTDAGSGP